MRRHRRPWTEVWSSSTRRRPLVSEFARVHAFHKYRYIDRFVFILDSEHTTPPVIAILDFDGGERPFRKFFPLQWPLTFSKMGWNFLTEVRNFLNYWKLDSFAFRQFRLHSLAQLKVSYRWKQICIMDNVGKIALYFIRGFFFSIFEKKTKMYVSNQNYNDTN